MTRCDNMRAGRDAMACAAYAPVEFYGSGGDGVSDYELISIMFMLVTLVIAVIRLVIAFIKVGNPRK